MRKASPQNVMAFAIVLLAAALTFYPVVWMLSASFKTNDEIFSTGSLAIGSAGWSNYTSSFAARPFFLYLVNSIAAAGVSVVISILLGCLAGYALAKFRFRFATALSLLILASVMIPLEAIVVPLFLEVHAFGWTNTYAALILPTAFNVVAIFIFRQAMVDIPDALIEAARIDGANEFRILRSVILPTVLPSVVVVAVLTFNLSWNSYLWPLIAVSDDGLRTLPLGMAAFQNAFNTQYGQVMAVSVFGALPTLVFFIVFQRYFIEGAITAGVK